MSLEKVKVSFKLDPQDWVFVLAEAKARGVNPAVILREVVGEYARIRAVAFSEARKRLAHQGLDGVLGGTEIRFARNLSDESDVVSAFEEDEDDDE